MKKLLPLSFLLFFVSILNGCGPIGQKNTNISIIYGTLACLSVILLITYCYIIYEKDVWFLLLFSSVAIINIGYFCLSTSTVLEEALLANRISYLGSVFLPMAMLFIILKTINIRWSKWVHFLLLIIAFIIFFIAASPGYSTIYYKEVSLQTVNGITFLEKVYGPCHIVYLFYLLSYFSVMVFIVLRVFFKKTIPSIFHSIILVITVFINIDLWLIEQLISINFEMLSISYIVTEVVLLGLNVILTENESLKITFPETPSLENTSSTDDSPLEQPISEVQHEFLLNLEKLTKTERIIFDYYILGHGTKEIMSELKITENTLKFHNKNIYSKLNVSSRKQLLEIYCKT